jgi:hypothetical protein
MAFDTNTPLQGTVWLVWKSAGSGPSLIIANGRPRGYAYTAALAGPGQTVQDALNALFPAIASAPNKFNPAGPISNPWNLPLSVSPQGGTIGTLNTVAGGGFTAISDAITSALDFMKFIAWIFSPDHLLRAVEFATGLVLMLFGLHAAMQGRGEQASGVLGGEGVLTRSGIGRVAAELGAAARRRETPRRSNVAPAPHRRPAIERRERHQRGERAITVREQRESRLSQQQQKRITGPKTKY